MWRCHAARGGGGGVTSIGSCTSLAWVKTLNAEIFSGVDAEREKGVKIMNI